MSYFLCKYCNHKFSDSPYYYMEDEDGLFATILKYPCCDHCKTQMTEEDVIEEKLFDKIDTYNGTNPKKIDTYKK